MMGEVGWKNVPGLLFPTPSFRMYYTVVLFQYQ